MKKITLALTVIMSFTLMTLNAQRDTWRDANNEINIGVKAFHFGPTDLMYKSRMGKSNWVRASITDLGFWDGETGFRLGVEKQKNLALRSRITYGLEPGIYFDYDKFDNTFAETSVDLGIPLGVQIHLSKSIAFGIESRPRFNIYESYIDDEGFRVESYRNGFKMFNGLRGSIAYRF